MMVLRKIIGCFFLLSSYLVLSQEDKEALPFEKTALAEVLQDLQHQYQIYISYNAKIVADKSLLFDSESENLSVALKEIEKKTRLVFEQIDPRNYILRESNKTNSIICGRIKKANTDEAISDVPVVAQPSGQYAYSDDHGYFELNGQTNDSVITIQQLGYDPKKMPFSAFFEKECQDVFLQERPFELDQVIVKSYLTAGISKNRDNTIRIVPEDIGLLPGVRSTDVLQSLQLLPGIQSPDDTATGLNIRGSTPDHNLILWDGIKLYRNDHFFGMISAVNANVIDNLEIYKNSAPSKYGNHLAGVIAIKSDNKIPQEAEVGLGMNMLAADGYLKIPISTKMALFLSARRSYTDVWETETFANFYKQIFQNRRITDIGRDITIGSATVKDKNTLFFNDFTVKLLNKLGSRSMLSTSFFNFRNRFNSRFQFQDVNSLITDGVDMGNLGFGMDWKMFWNDRWHSTLALNTTSYIYDYKGEEELSNIFNSEVIKSNEVYESTANFSVTYDFNANYSMTNGLGVNQFLINHLISTSSDFLFEFDGSTKSVDNTTTVLGVHSEHRYVNDKWSLIAGIRADYFRTFSKVYLQPRATISRRLSESLSLNLLGEIQYLPTSQILEFETENFGLENQIWVASDNEGIPLLNSNQLELGATFNTKKWLVDASLYRKRINNIASFTQDFSKSNSGLNIGNSAINGFEVLLKRKYQNFNSLISYSFTDNDLTFSNINDGKSFESGFNTRHSMSFIQTFEYGKLKMALNWRFKTSRPYTPALGVLGDDVSNYEIDFAPINSARLNNFHRMDFSVAYRTALSKSDKLNATFGFELLNVYNQRNVLTRNHRLVVSAADGGINLRRVDGLSLSRTPMVSFRIDF